MKTRVATSRRSSSAEASREPFSSARFGSVADRRMRSAVDTPARVPSIPIAAACAPNRISCASLRVRGEKPCVPTWSDSSRFVLPAPFRPTTRTTPGREGEVGRRIRAIVAKRDALDDQVRGSYPASLIGMIRYT